MTAVFGRETVQARQMLRNVLADKIELEPVCSGRERSRAYHHPVAAFLRQQAPAPVCHGCLTTSLQISYQDAQRAVTMLRLSGEFQVLVGQQCSAGRRQRVAVWAVEAQGQSGS